jgi:GNAT superfamily N-acetyltransferase
MEIRRLRQEDDRTAFRSGHPDLDRFFHQFAGQNQFRLHLGVTYVAVEGGRVVGFATVSPGHLEIESLPATDRRKLPRYPIPVLRLARLAVDAAARGQGVGRKLLRYVLALSTRMKEDFGCAGVLVDAKPGMEEFYGAYGFIPLEALEGASDARPAPIPMFLTMGEIRKAME